MLFRMMISGASVPTFYTQAERATALAVAQEMHDKGRTVRLTVWGGTWRCLFDSKQRARRKVGRAA